MRIVYILLFLAAVGWLIYSWRIKAGLRVPVIAAVGTLILNIFPAISYLLLVGALVWLGFSFYKKKDKKLPVIAAAAALVLTFTMPSGSGSVVGGGNAGGNSFTAGGRDFSSAAKVEAYFQAALERNYPDAQLRNVSSASWTTLLYNREPIEGYFIVTQMIPSPEDRAAGHSPESFKYFVTEDGKIFDATDMSDLRPIG